MNRARKRVGYRTGPDQGGPPQSESAGLKLRWHDLRSHWGSKLAHDGAGADKIQALLGQSSLASTQKYIQHSPESLRSTAKGADSRNLKGTTPIATPNPENQPEKSKAAVNS